MKFEHNTFVTALIRDQIDEVDSAARDQATGDDEMEQDAPVRAQEHTADPSGEELSVVDNLPYQRRRSTFEAGAATLRSRQPPVELSHLESLEDQGIIFSNFRTKLSAWLTYMLPLYELSFPPGCTRVDLQGTDKVSTTTFHIEF